MSNYFEKYMKSTLIKYFYKKTVVSQEEVKKLTEEEKKQYRYSNNEYIKYDDEKIEESEIPQIVQFKTLEELSEIKK